jgi:hypothetical protein
MSLDNNSDYAELIGAYCTGDFIKTSILRKYFIRKRLWILFFDDFFSLRSASVRYVFGLELAHGMIIIVQCRVLSFMFHDSEPTVTCTLDYDRC